MGQRRPTPTPLPRTPPEADNTRGSLHVHVDDHVDLDPHESDMLNAAVDFDDYGNELDCADPIFVGDEDPDWRETCS